MRPWVRPCGVMRKAAVRGHAPTVQTRAFPRNNAGKRQAIFYGTWDLSLSLMIAFFVNAAILITAAGAPLLIWSSIWPLGAASSRWRRFPNQERMAERPLQQLDLPCSSHSGGV